MRVRVPTAERLPPLILRAVTRCRRLRSAALLSGGTSGWATKTNSSEMKRWMRRHSRRCGASGSARKGWQSASKRRSQWRWAASRSASTGLRKATAARVALLHAGGPAPQASVGGVHARQFVDLAQQMRPAALMQARIVVVGGVEVGHQHPGEVVPQRGVHHRLVPSAADEIALRRRAEGPDVAVPPLLSPAGLVAVDHGARLHLGLNLLDGRLALLGDPLQHRSQPAQAQLDLVHARQIALDGP